MLERLRCGWTGMQDQLIAEIDRDYGVYDGRTFKLDRFANISPPTGSHGHDLKAANSISVTTRSDNRLKPIRRYRLYASSAPAWPNCD